MFKSIYTLVLVISIGIVPIIAQQSGGQYGVLVGAFDQSVSTDYFKGIGSTYLQVDQNDIYRYYIGNFSSLADAESSRQQADDAGYFARVVDFDEQARQCALSCALPVRTSAEPSYLESIFFDFDQAYLRQKSKYELDKLIGVLNDNPTYTTELRAHTDSKGSNGYNDGLSQRRAESAKKYLIQKGISTHRINATTYGEENPIARNELAGGVDTPEGRQLNRRVELVVKNAEGGVVQIVRDINVPSRLSYIGG